MVDDVRLFRLAFLRLVVGLARRAELDAARGDDDARAWLRWLRGDL